MAKRVGLVPAADAFFTTAPGGLTSGQLHYRNTLDRLAAKYGESPALPVTPQRQPLLTSTPAEKKRKRRRAFLRKKITAKNITPGEEALLEEAAKLQRAAKRKRGKKITAKNITPAQEALIEEAAKLQRGAKQRGKKKFDLKVRFAKKPTYRRQKGSLKRAPPRPKASFDRRTTLLSLMRRIPDAKKPLLTWLK